MNYFTREFFLVLTIFSKELFGIKIGDSHVNAYQLAVAAYGFLFFFKPRQLSPIILALLGIVVSSLLIFTYYDYPVSNIFIRQSAAVSFVYVGFAAFLSSCSPDRLAIAYIRVCFFAAVFGIFQFALSAVGIFVLLNLPLRLDSFAGEPSHYAVAVAPCVYYCFRYGRTGRARIRTVIVLISVALTISATAVGVSAVAFALAFYSRRGFVAIFMIVIAIPFLRLVPADFFPDVIATRITSTKAYVNDRSEPWETENLTVLSFATNFEVMKSTVLDARILGNGWCGHSIAYSKRFENTEFVEHRHYGINAPAAHCLVIRIVSEFGLVGAFVLGYTIWHFVSDRRTDLFCMFFVMAIIARAFKLGSWIDFGLPIFILAPYFVTQRSQQKEHVQRQWVSSRREPPQVKAAAV